MKTAALRLLKQNKDYLTRHQLKTLRGQILAGDIEVFLKGLRKMIGRPVSNQ